MMTLFNKSFFLLFFISTLFSSFSIRAEDIEITKVLGQAQELSTKIGELGAFGEGKTKDADFEQYNSQMVQNNNLTQSVLKQVSDQLGVKLPTEKKNEDPVTKGLSDLKGLAFKKAFLTKGVGLQSQLLELLKTKLLPGTSSPLTTGLLKTLTPALSRMVDKGSALISKETSVSK